MKELWIYIKLGFRVIYFVTRESRIPHNCTLVNLALPKVQISALFIVWSSLPIGMTRCDHGASFIAGRVIFLQRTFINASSLVLYLLRSLEKTPVLQPYY
jgi:hypothetical protein